jgi:hypothetical protein
MFNVAVRPTFRRTVAVTVPDGDGSRTESFIAYFRGLPDDEIAKFDLATVNGTKAFLRAVIVQLDDILDEAEDPLPYRDDVREAVLAWPNARIALARSYFEGFAQAAEGN